MWTPQASGDDTSKLVPVMAWYVQTTGLCLRQFWQQPMTPTKLPVVKILGCRVVILYWGLLSRAMPLTHWGRDEIDDISRTTFSNAFYWMKMYWLRLEFHWSLFPRVQLTMFQHWLRWWLVAGQATSHYLNQWGLFYWRIYASLGLNELKHNHFPSKYIPVDRHPTGWGTMCLSCVPSLICGVR